MFLISINPLKGSSPPVIMDPEGTLWGNWQRVVVTVGSILVVPMLVLPKVVVTGAVVLTLVG